MTPLFHVLLVWAHLGASNSAACTLAQCSTFTAAELELIQESMEGALMRLRKRATEQRVQEALLLHGVHEELDEGEEEY